MLLKETEKERRNETHTLTREPWNQDANGGGRGTYGAHPPLQDSLTCKNMEVLESDKEVIQ